MLIVLIMACASRVVYCTRTGCHWKIRQTSHFGETKARLLHLIILTRNYWRSFRGTRLLLQVSVFALNQASGTSNFQTTKFLWDRNTRSYRFLIKRASKSFLAVT